MTKKMTIELPDGVTTKLEGTSPKFLILLDIDTPEAADELKKRIDEAVAKRPAGMPEDGQEVFILHVNGHAGRVSWDSNDLFFVACFNIGNVFLTEAECIAEIDRRKALQRVKVWRAENTEPFEPDWKNQYQTKWSIYYDHIEQKFLVTDRNYCNPLSGIPPFGLPSDAKRLIKSCESDLRTLAGVK